MKLQSLRFHEIALPLVRPFTTSFATQTERRALLLEGRFDTERGDVTGWGECVAMESPLYSSEYLHGCADVIERWLAPALFGVDDLTAETVGHHLRPVVGHPMAKAAVEMVVLDAQLRSE